MTKDSYRPTHVKHFGKIRASLLRRSPGGDVSAISASQTRGAGGLSGDTTANLVARCGIEGALLPLFCSAELGMGAWGKFWPV